jgi:hypothetical protein
MKSYVASMSFDTISNNIIVKEKGEKSTALYKPIPGNSMRHEILVI